jgi:hypothetical protein
MYTFMQHDFINLIQFQIQLLSNHSDHESQKSFAEKYPTIIFLTG